MDSRSLPRLLLPIPFCPFTKSTSKHFVLGALFRTLSIFGIDVKMKEKSPDYPLSDSSEGDGTLEQGTPINEKALIRKLDLKLLPAVTVLYLLSFLDRSNGRIA